MIASRLMSFDYYVFLNCFIIYSFLGWLMECIVLSIQEHTVIKNTGFVRGPFCTIYGAGAMLAYYVLGPVSDNVFILFLFGMTLASIVELLTAVVMTRLFGDFWWDYNQKPFNYKGILCLESSLGWGFLTVFFFKFIHPAIEHFVDLYPVNIGKAGIAIVTVVYLVDFTTSFHRSRKDYNLSKHTEED